VIRLTLENFSTLAARVAVATEPVEVYRAVEQVLAKPLGFGLLTMLVVTPNAEEVERVYSSNCQAYPLAGRKRMGLTPWGDLVMRQRQPFLGRDVEAIRWAFPDHALIASLGLGSAINVPVVSLGRLLGTINVLDAAGRYDEQAVKTLQAVVPILVAPFLRELKI
jgi:GAF domain-containing protein